MIDHHRYEHERVLIPFRDCRPEAVASASIVASYLREQNIEPGPKLATAMWYAMRTETRGEEFRYSLLDRSILLWLTERAEPPLLAEIESAPLGAEYYGDLVLAIQNTFVYGQTALCLLPRAAGAEIVGEVADLLIRYRPVHRVLCGAVVGKDLFVSVRPIQIRTVPSSWCKRRLKESEAAVGTPIEREERPPVWAAAHRSEAAGNRNSAVAGWLLAMSKASREGDWWPSVKSSIISDKIWTEDIGNGPLMATAIHDGHDVRPEVARHLAPGRSGTAPRRRSIHPRVDCRDPDADCSACGRASRWI